MDKRYTGGMGRYTQEEDEGYNNLKEVILPRLDELGMTVEMLTQKIRSKGFHITRATVYYWLADKRRPLPDLAKVTAHALQLPESTLLDAYTPRNRTPLNKLVGEKGTGPTHPGTKSTKASR